MEGGKRKSELVNYFGSLDRSLVMNVEMGQLYLHWRYNFFQVEYENLDDGLEEREEGENCQQWHSWLLVIGAIC